jgi:hypothetical protein
MDFNQSEDLNTSLLASRDKREQLARQMFQEVQEGYYQVPMEFFKALNEEFGDLSN